MSNGISYIMTLFYVLVSGCAHLFMFPHNRKLFFSLQNVTAVILQVLRLCAVESNMV
jgi:hypothetical protein